MAEVIDLMGDTLVKLAETLKQVGNVANMLHDRMVDIESRQDMLWKALQGLMEKYNEQEQALINLGKEIRDGEEKL